MSGSLAIHDKGGKAKLIMWGIGQYGKLLYKCGVLPELTVRVILYTRVQ